MLAPEESDENSHDDSSMNPLVVKSSDSEPEKKSKSKSKKKSLLESKLENLPSSTMRRVASTNGSLRRAGSSSGLLLRKTPSERTQRRGSTGSKMSISRSRILLSAGSLNKTSKSNLFKDSTSTAANGSENANANASWNPIDPEPKAKKKEPDPKVDETEEEGGDTVTPLMASKPFNSNNRKSLFKRAASLKRFGLSKSTKDSDGSETDGSKSTTALSTTLDSTNTNNKPARTRFFQKAASMRIGKSPKWDSFDEMSLNEQSDEFSLHSTNHQPEPSSTKPTRGEGLSSLGQSLRRLNDISLVAPSKDDDGGSSSQLNGHGSSSRIGDSSSCSIASPTLWRENSEEMRPGLQFAPSTIATMLTEKLHQNPPKLIVKNSNPTIETTAETTEQKSNQQPSAPIGEASTPESELEEKKEPISEHNDDEAKPDMEKEESSDLPDSAEVESKAERPKKLKRTKSKNKGLKPPRNKKSSSKNPGELEENGDEMGKDSGHSKKSRKVRKKRKGGKRQKSEKQADEENEVNEDNAMEEGSKSKILEREVSEREESEHKAETEFTEVEEEPLPEESEKEAERKKSDMEEAAEIQSTDGDSDIVSLTSAKKEDDDDNIDKDESKKSLVDESTSKLPSTDSIPKSQDSIEPSEPAWIPPPAPVRSKRQSKSRSKSPKNPLLKNLAPSSPRRRKDAGSHFPKLARAVSKRLSTGSDNPKSNAGDDSDDDESSRTSRRKTRRTALQKSTSIFGDKMPGQKTRRRRSLGGSAMKVTADKGKGYISSFLGGSGPK